MSRTWAPLHQNVNLVALVAVHASRQIRNRGLNHVDDLGVVLELALQSREVKSASSVVPRKAPLNAP